MRTSPLILSVLFAIWSVEAAEKNALTVVRNANELRTALATLKDGAILKIGPGEYPGGHYIEKTAGLTIEALDPQQPPHFKGSANAWHFARCPKLTLRNLIVSGQTDNGLNIDDGGELTKAVRGITIENIAVNDIGPTGNHDGIKCSGLDELVIRDCSITGWGGQGIDMVGCHKVTISGCTFKGKAGFSATAGVQMKGGTADVCVEKCRFKDAGERPLNIGGSTGLAYFRPQGAKFEAARITVRNNVIEASPCAAAFVGVDGAEFSGNTILFPEKWIFRILQETIEKGFAPCRNVFISSNRIVFRRSQVRDEINIGPNTAADSFRFEQNKWFAEDRPQESSPTLPSEEKDGIYSRDPR